MNCYRWVYSLYLCLTGLQGIIRLCLSLIFWDWPERGLWFWFYSMTSSRKLLLNWMWLSQITLQQNLRLLFTRIWLNPCLREIIDLFAVTDNKLHVWLMILLSYMYKNVIIIVEFGEDLHNRWNWQCWSFGRGVWHYSQGC